MQIEHRNVNVIQEFSVILDRVTRGHKNDNLLLCILFEKGEEKEEPLFTGTDHISLDMMSF